MRTISLSILLALLPFTLAAAPTTHPSAAAPTTTPIAWQPWSKDIFAQAKRENKFVLLDLHAVWCHWCHVMDDNTYHDPAVIDLINKKYIPVGVDADSRPDLTNRYEDYGWPATIVFSPDGKEIVKRQGYLPPRQMASILQAIIDDPTPGPSVTPPEKITFTTNASLTDDLRKELTRRQNDAYDTKFGGWGTIHKYLDWDAVEWSLNQAAAGNTTADQRARQTLDAQLHLLDPVWGGVYQYSTDGDWNHPHFEKIMQFQAENMRIYALAYQQFHDDRYLKAAKEINRYLTTFLLSPDGGYYTSQDADPIPGQQGADYFKLDDSSRRAQGIPRVDQHQYARENGWAITALCQLHAASPSPAILDQALKSAEWVIANRSLPAGGFSHDQHDPAGPYLGDTLAMGRAFLSLYQTTADRQWLLRAASAADFIRAHFLNPDHPGVATSDLSSSQSFPPDIDVDENTTLARFANLLAWYTGKKSDRDLALSAMRYITTPQIAGARHMLLAGILLADTEISTPPLHITILAPRNNPTAAALFQTAASLPVPYKRLEWLDPSQGPLMNSDVEYPSLPNPAAFLCQGTTCSSPAYSPEELLTRYHKSQPIKP